MFSLLVALGPGSPQHVLASFLIGGAQRVDIARGEPPSRNLTESNPDHLGPVHSLRSVRLVQHLVVVQVPVIY
jgi:hypothetical protein